MSLILNGIFRLVYHFFVVIIISNQLGMNENQSSLLTASLLEQEQPEQKVTFLSIFQFANHSEKVYMVVGIITSALAGLTFPFFLMFFGQITDLFTDRQTSAAKGFAICQKFLIIGVLYWIMTFTSLYCWSYSGSTQSMKLKKLYYQTLLQQEIAWYDSNDVGKLASKVAKNISTIQNAIGQKIALLISAIFTSSFGIIFAFVHCWQLSLFLTGVLPIVIYTGFLLMRSHGLRAKINNASYENASGIAEQAFHAIRTIKYLVGEIFEVNKFSEALKIGNKKSVRYIAYVSLFVAGFTFVQFAIYSLGMWLGKWILIWNVESHKYSPADIIGTFYCVVSGGSAFGQISPILRNLAEGRQAFADLMNLINRKKTLDELKGSKKIVKIKNISLKSVFFTYKILNEDKIEQNSTLKNISLDFVPKKVNAIVGESGCGKSTIIQLLMRFYDCSSGSITINNSNIRQINIRNFRRKIGFVGQEPVLFAMSIQDNLRIANSKLTESQIVQALKKANAWEFVEKMEKGIKTFVGSGGTQISGGQKQRIAIARAICKKPQLLILDEATSALDRKNEKQIQLTLQNLEEENITTIVIAHRLSTIKNAHKIFVLDKGELKQQGNHNKLIELKGIYERLVHTQIQAQKKTISVQHLNSSQSLQQVNPSEQNEQNGVREIEQMLEISEQQIKGQSLQEKMIYRKLLKRSLPYGLFLIVGAMSSLINGSIVPCFSIIFGHILAQLNDVLANEDKINSLCLYFLLIAIGASITAFLYNFCFGIVGDRVVYDLRIEIFEKILKMPMKYFDNKDNTPGSISTKLSKQAYQIHNMITGVIAIVCLNLSAVVVSLIIAIVNCWKIALITLAFTPLLMIVTSISVSITKRMATKSERSQKLIGSLISDTVSNIRTVKSFGRNSFFIEKFEESLQQLNKIAFERSLKISFFQGMRRAIIVITQGFIFWIVSYMYTEGVITQDSQYILVAIFAIIYSSNSIGQNSQHMPDLAKAKRSGAILFNILQNKDQEQINKEEGGVMMSEIKGSIQFRNVSFKYPERDAMILQNFNLAVGQGQKIGLVGESGSGKSTVIQLIMRLYPPTSGEIFIDGINIKQYDLYRLRSQIGVVSQEPTMFLGTVIDNIQYNSSANLDKVNEVITIAGCKKFISQWPDGFEKQVGQKGSQISGGQKQRLAIARSLIRQPKLILFDESTSALDADTQSMVFQNLKPILSKITSLSIAHRLSTIQDAKRIIVMRYGRIIQSGTYSELMKLKSSFYRLAQGK